MADDAPQPSRPMPLEERRDPEAPVTRADLARVQKQLADGGQRMSAIESELRMNTAVTSDVRALLEATRVGLKVLGALGTVATWAAKIIGAAAAIYAAWQAIKHGK